MRKTIAGLIAATVLAVASSRGALAADLINVEADAAPTTRGPTLHGDCLFENVSATETLEVTFSATMTFSDGSSAPAATPDTTVLEPGTALVISLFALIPEGAPAGSAVFTCHGDAEVVQGQEPGRTDSGEAADPFSVVTGYKRL